MGSKLSAAADRAVNISTRDTRYVCGDSEPSLVARLVAALPDQLVKRWRPYFATGMLEVTSAFCHPRPQAHWEVGLGAGRPELCDLLLLVASPDKSGVMTEHALLVQAKKGDGGKTSLSAESELKQRYMYAKWPDFHIARGDCKGSADSCAHKSPTNTRRIVSEGLEGARYGIVSKDERPAWYIEEQQATWNPVFKPTVSSPATFEHVSSVSIAAGLSMGEALEMMVNKKLGHPIQLVGTDDWTDVISALVTNALDLHFGRTNFHMVKHTPGAPLVPLSAASAFLTTSPSVVSLKHSALHRWPFTGKSKFSQDRGGARFSSPPVASTEEPIYDGYGVIRIVVNGHFKEREHLDRRPKTQPNG